MTFLYEKMNVVDFYIRKCHYCLIFYTKMQSLTFLYQRSPLMSFRYENLIIDDSYIRKDSH